MMKIYLDDCRQEPIGWMRTYSAQETIDLLKNNIVEEISLDHDLGDDEIFGTGYEVLVWMEKEVIMNNYIPPNIIHIHTANPGAYVKMQAAVNYIMAIK